LHSSITSRVYTNEKLSFVKFILSEYKLGSVKNRMQNSEGNALNLKKFTTTLIGHLKY